MKNKEALGAWITAEEKEAWKELARKNNMTLSAFISHTLKEILHKRKVKENLDPPQCSVQDLNEEIHSSVKVRFTKSELDALRELSQRRGQSRQEVIVAAVRQLLLQKLQIDPFTKQAVLDSTLELNKVGVNLNQIARVLNTQAKVGDIKEEEIRSALQAISVMDEHISSHIKTVDNFLKEHSRRTCIILQETS